MLKILERDFSEKSVQRSIRRRADTQLTFTSSKSTIETVEKGVKYIQS